MGLSGLGGEVVRLSGVSGGSVRGERVGLSGVNGWACQG